MPRRLRNADGNLIYHVLNRAVGRGQIFDDEQDYLAFERVIERTWQNLVKSARQWPWCSLSKRRGKDPAKWLLPMDHWPIDPPDDWPAWVDRPQTAAELEALQSCVKRSRPFGDPKWQLRTARRLGLESTLRPRGRQRVRAIKDSRPL